MGDKKISNLFLLIPLFFLVACSAYSTIGPEDGYNQSGDNYSAIVKARTGTKLLHVKFSFFNNSKQPVLFDYRNVKLIDNHGIIIEALDPRWVASMAASGNSSGIPEYVPPAPSIESRTYGTVSGYQSGNYFYGTGQASTYSYETSESQFARAAAPGAHALGYVLGQKLGEALTGKTDSPEEYLIHALKPQVVDPGTGIEGMLYYMKPDQSRYPLDFIVGDDKEKIHVPVG